jgi:hypothetical protein
MPSLLFVPRDDDHAQLSPGLKPRHHIFYKYRVVDFDDGLPKHDEFLKSSRLKSDVRPLTHAPRKLLAWATSPYHDALYTGECIILRALWCYGLS